MADVVRYRELNITRTSASDVHRLRHLPRSGREMQGGYLRQIVEFYGHHLGR